CHRAHGDEDGEHEHLHEAVRASINPACAEFVDPPLTTGYPGSGGSLLVLPRGLPRQRRGHGPEILQPYRLAGGLQREQRRRPRAQPDLVDLACGRIEDDVLSPGQLVDHPNTTLWGPFQPGLVLVGSGQSVVSAQVEGDGWGAGVRWLHGVCPFGWRNRPRRS